MEILNGDCLEFMAQIPEDSIDAIVTDPPYELGFMGKSWDASGVAFCPDTWRLAWRVLKPGAHLVAFGAPKNYHRLACAIEDAGFEIRDSLMWVFGSGFPKSLDVSKAIDKSGGVDVSEFKRSLREYVDRSGKSRSEIDALCGFTMRFDTMREADPTGWGCSLPSPDKWLKICEVLGCDASLYQELIDRVWRGKSTEVASKNKSMSGANYKRTDKGNPVFDAARQWEGWGTALKPAYEPIVLARKPLSEGTVAANVLRWGTGALNIDATRIGEPFISAGGPAGFSTEKGWNQNNMGAHTAKKVAGRWPANLCHDGSQGVLDLFPHTKSGRGNGMASVGEEGDITPLRRGNLIPRTDDGSAARFFYCPKASKHDRAGSKHPTVKPINLMRWLIRMVTPIGGVILDPFAGSGTTGAAAAEEGFKSILIEREAEYFEDINKRMSSYLPKDQKIG